MLRTALMLVVLFIAGAAHAEKPDLTGADLVLQGVCRLMGTAAPCFLYEKEGVRYVALPDEEEGGFAVIYRIRDGAALPYRATDFELLWSKDYEEKMQA